MALLISNALGFTGEQMRVAAQSWWILEQGGSKMEMGFAAGLRIIPVLIITLYGGVLIDRVGGKRILIVERTFLIFLGALTGLILLFDQVEIWHVIILSTLAGSTIAFGAPAKQTLAADVVPADLRQSANSMNQLGSATGRTLGPLLAGILISIRSAALALFGLAIVYVVSLIATFGITSKRSPNDSSDSALRQIIGGFVHIKETPVLLWTGMLGVSFIFLGMIFPIIPVYAQDLLEIGEVGFGGLWGAVAIGQAAGAIFIASRGGFKRKSLGAVFGTGIFGVGLIGFGLSDTYWLSFIFLFINGLGFPMVLTSAITLLQNHSKPEYRGRVMAVWAIMLQGVSLAWMLGGFLLDAIGPMPTVLVAVGGGWALALIPFFASRDFRRA